MTLTGMKETIEYPKNVGFIRSLNNDSNNRLRCTSLFKTSRKIGNFIS